MRIRSVKKHLITHPELRALLRNGEKERRGTYKGKEEENFIDLKGEKTREFPSLALLVKSISQTYALHVRRGKEEGRHKTEAKEEDPPSLDHPIQEEGRFLLDLVVRKGKSSNLEDIRGKWEGYSLAGGGEKRVGRFVCKWGGGGVVFLKEGERRYAEYNKRRGRGRHIKRTKRRGSTTLPSSSTR